MEPIADADLGADWFSGSYRDGCGVHASCFTCPLPDCRLSKSGAAVNHRRAEATAGQMRPLLAEGRSMTDIAATLGISRRQAFRLARMVRS